MRPYIQNPSRAPFPFLTVRSQELTLSLGWGAVNRKNRQPEPVQGVRGTPRPRSHPTRAHPPLPTWPPLLAGFSLFSPEIFTPAGRLRCEQLKVYRGTSRILIQTDTGSRGQTREFENGSPSGRESGAPAPVWAESTEAARLSRGLNTASAPLITALITATNSTRTEL